MTVRSAAQVSAGCGDLAAIDLLVSLGWTFKNLYAETFGDPRPDPAGPVDLDLDRHERSGRHPTL